MSRWTSYLQKGDRCLVICPCIAPAAAPAWYCIQTAPKQESKVAGLLQREIGLKVFSPKIRFRRNRAGRPIWWTEALFPGYLFARFDFFLLHRRIRALSGVATIVQFGERPAAVPETVMENLQQLLGEEETVEIAGIQEPTSEVLIVEGPLRGLQVLVTRIMPARERIAVLLHFLGAEREVEISLQSAIPVNPRTASAAGFLRSE